MSDQGGFLIASEKKHGGEKSLFSPLKESKIIYKSVVMSQLINMMNKVSLSDAKVLILGESGTGKELIAREIHRRSHRSNKPFVPINCGSLQKALLESELFGYEKGAFTGAFSRKIGLVELADGGTLFLDEIGELNPESQVKLLRFLQENEVLRLGGQSPIKVDVRLISATNRELDQEMKDGFFREDLFYRINTISLQAPPLRHRREDIPLLVNHFLSQEMEKSSQNLKGEKIWICSEVMKAILNYHWPGNIRELQSVCKRIHIFSEKNRISLKDLPEDIFSSIFSSIDTSRIVKDYDPSISLQELEKVYILKALQYFLGNKTKAARALGVTIKTLYNKLHEYGELEAQNFRIKKQDEEVFSNRQEKTQKPSRVLRKNEREDESSSEDIVIQ